MMQGYLSLDGVNYFLSTGRDRSGECKCSTRAEIDGIPGSNTQLGGTGKIIVEFDLDDSGATAGDNIKGQVYFAYSSTTR